MPVGSEGIASSRTRLANVRIKCELKIAQLTASIYVIGLEEDRCPVSTTDLVRKSSLLVSTSLVTICDGGICSSTFSGVCESHIIYSLKIFSYTFEEIKPVFFDSIRVIQVMIDYSSVKEFKNDIEN